MADNFNVLKCPACQKEMTKVFVPSEGVNIDICLDGCGGIYFDNKEYYNFDEQKEDVDIIVDEFSIFVCFDFSFSINPKWFLLVYQLSAFVLLDDDIGVCY